MDITSVPSTVTRGASQRLRQASQNSKYAQERTQDSSNQEENCWTRRASAINPKTRATILNQDGFTTVSKPRQGSTGNLVKPAQKGRRSTALILSANTYGIPFQPETTTSQTRKRSLLSTSPPSLAAAKRASLYPSRGKSDFGLEQSSLPQNKIDFFNGEAEKIRGSTLTKEQFKLGMIVRAVHHEPDFPHGFPSATAADEYRTDSRFGRICSKYRKMIVIALYRDHYVAVPLYTHNGRGPENRIDADEFVSVRDHRLPGPFQALSAHRPLVTGLINAGMDLWHTKSAAHFTYPVSRKYGLPVIVEGTLENDSLMCLMALVNTYVGKGTSEAMD